MYVYTRTYTNNVHKLSQYKTYGNIQSAYTQYVMLTRTKNPINILLSRI